MLHTPLKGWPGHFVSRLMQETFDPQLSSGETLVPKRQGGRCHPSLDPVCHGAAILSLGSPSSWGDYAPFTLAF